MKKPKILITEKLQSEEIKNFDLVFLFNCRKSYDSKKIFSILHILENEKIIKKDEINDYISKNIRELFKINRKLFKNTRDSAIIFSLFSEKNVFLNNFYFKFFQYFIFQKLIQKYNKNNKLFIKLEDKELKYFFKKKNFFFTFKNILNIFKSIIRACYYNIKKNFSLKFKNNFSFKEYRYLFIDQYSNFSNGSSNIWHILLKQIELKNYLEVAVNNDKTQKHKKFKNLCLNDFNNLGIFLKNFINYFILVFKIIFFLKNKNQPNRLELIFFDHLKKNFIHSNLMKANHDFEISKNFFTYYHFKYVFIISENQSWEKILIYNLKKYNTNSICYQYIHTPIRYWDLRYDTKIYGKFREFFDPDVVCLISRQCYDLYSESVSSINLKKVEGLRYLYLDKNYLSNNNNIKKDILEYKFVLVGDISPSSTMNLYYFLNSYSQLIKKKISVYFKPHPKNQLKIVNTKFLKILKFSKIKSDTPLIFIFPNYTSASVDFNFLDYICLTYVSNNNFNLSPLFIMKNYSNYFYDFESFEKLLENIKYINFKKNLKHNLFLNKDINYWKSLFN